MLFLLLPCCNLGFKVGLKVVDRKVTEEDENRKV